MSDCAGCRGLERALQALERQLEAKDAQLAVLLGVPAGGAPSAGEGSPAGGQIEQVMTEGERRKQMADFIDSEGVPCMLVDGLKVPVDEYLRAMGKLDMEISGSKIWG